MLNDAVSIEGMEVRRTKYSWEGFRAFPALVDLGTHKLRAWARTREKEVPAGLFRVYFDIEASRPLSSECLRSWQHFANSEPRLCELAVAAAFAHYQHITPWLDQWVEPENRDEIAPRCNDVLIFSRLIAFECLHIHPADDLGADLGLQFTCSWDEEHGLGVRIRGDRVVSVSDAIHAFERWDWVRQSIETLGDGLSKGPRTKD